MGILQLRKAVVVISHRVAFNANHARTHTHTHTHTQTPTESDISVGGAIAKMARMRWVES